MRADPSFSHNFEEGENMIEKGVMPRKKYILRSFQGYPRSIKVIWVIKSFCIPIDYLVAKRL